MSKKYQIINSNIDSNTSEECTIFYILYIVLFFVIVFIIYKIIFCFDSPKEGFENVSTTADLETKISKNKSDYDFEITSTINNRPNRPNNRQNNRLNNRPNNRLNNRLNNRQNNRQNNRLNDNETLENLTEKNMELKNMRDTLQNKLLEQSQAIYLSQNFDKVDPSSFNDQLSFLLVDFADTRFPEINMDNKKIINNQNELNNVLSEAANMKNFYKPGDIVNQNSTFDITKNDICYRQNDRSIKPTPEFIKKFPNCMVCDIEDDNVDLKNTSGWRNTRTNISKVCLYNPDAKPNSGIPNLKQCQTFCKINKPNIQNRIDSMDTRPNNKN